MHDSHILLSKGRVDEAEEKIRTALGQHMKDAGLLYFMGLINMHRGNWAVAAILFERACEVKPDFAEGLANWGVALRRLLKREEAVEVLLKSLEIKPGQMDVLCNLSAAYVNEGQPEKGEAYARKALEINPDYDKAQWNLALILLEQGKWAEGFDLYVHGIKTGSRLYRNFREGGTETPTLYELSDWKPGEVVCLYGEQGLGDEVLLSSCIPDMLEHSRKLGHRFSNLIIESHGALERVFRRSFPDIEVMGTREKDITSWPLERKIDWGCPLGNMPKFFRRKDDDFPQHGGYMKPDLSRSGTYRNQLEYLAQGRPIIGIGWTGGFLKTMATYRTISLDELLPVLEQEACFVSLQHQDDEGAVSDFEDMYGIRINRLPEASQSNDVDKLIALIDACDLIITVCNSLHHFAGAIAKDCWTLVPSRPAWRYNTDTPTSIWYPRTSMLLRQPPGGDDKDWTAPIQLAADNLKGWIDAYHAGAETIRAS